MTNDPFKVKPLRFKDLPREAKLANALWAHQSPYREEIEQTLKREGWKTGPSLLPNETRGATSPLGGAAKRK